MWTENGICIMQNLNRMADVGPHDLALASNRFWGIWAICFNRVNVLKLSL